MLKLLTSNTSIDETDTSDMLYDAIIDNNPENAFDIEDEKIFKDASPPPAKKKVEVRNPSAGGKRSRKRRRTKRRRNTRKY